MFYWNLSCFVCCLLFFIVFCIERFEALKRLFKILKARVDFLNFQNVVKYL